MKVNRIILVVVSACLTGLLLFLISNMESDNFYVHLSSNVYKDSPLQVGNSIGNFVTRLSRRLNLTDDWEVGLTQMSYTKSWYNIIDDQIIQIKDLSESIDENTNTLTAGYYKTAEILIECIN